MNVRKNGVPEMVLTVELPRGQYRAKTSKSPYISGGDNTKDIPNYEGIYAITEDGRLWSYKKKQFITPSYGKTSKYPIYSLCKNGKRFRTTVSRLVAMAYIHNDDCTLVVDHIDGDIENNHFSNLQWITQKKNIHRSYKTMGPIRNYRTCKLYYKDKLIKTFGSVSSACRYYQTEFNGSYSSLAKYRKIGDFEVRCND